MEPRLYGSRPLGAAIGLLALFAGLAVAELVVGLLPGAPSPIVAVGQTVIDVVPPGVKDWAIETFGTSNKLVLVTGTVIVLALFGAAVGVLAVRQDRSSAYVLAVAVGVIGVLAVVSRPTASASDALPTVIGTATTVAVLWWCTRRLPSTGRPPSYGTPGTPTNQAPCDTVGEPGSGPAQQPAQRIGPAPRMGVDRRGVLVGAAGIGVLALAAGGVGRLLQRRVEIGDERADLVLPSPSSRAVPLPPDVEFGLDGVTPFVTPNDRFFRIDTALTVPQVSRFDWRLRISGMVERELELDFDDLLARQQVERHITLSCVSNQVGGDLVGTARWQGVLLADVLAEAGVLAGADQLVSRSVDGWTCGTPTAAVVDGRDALIAIGMNGEPLPARHGYPVRLVVPGLFGYVSATKWVTDIELTTWDAFDAYWVPRGWAKEGPVKTMTRIDRPRRGDVPSGGYDIAGVAWAVHRGISAVEVRVDEGEWVAADLGGVPSDDTWRQWRLRWDATPGVHVIEARAIDGDGVPQPSEPRSVAPDGAQGYHRVRVDVRA